MFQRYFAHSHSASSGCSLAKSGLLSIGAALRAEYSIEQGMFCSLFYDAERRLIGLQFHPADERPAGSAKVTKLTRGTAVSARGFKNRFGIAPGRFSSEYDEVESMIVLSRESPPK